MDFKDLQREMARIRPKGIEIVKKSKSIHYKNVNSAKVKKPRYSMHIDHRCEVLDVGKLNVRKSG